MTLVNTSAITEHDEQPKAISNKGANLQMSMTGQLCERLSRIGSEHSGEHFGIYTSVMRALANPLSSLRRSTNISAQAGRSGHFRTGYTRATRFHGSTNCARTHLR
jgi:hypothetical protein